MKHTLLYGALALLLPLWCAAAPSEVPPRLVAPVVPERGQALAPLQRLARLALERSPGTREAQANWRAAVQDAQQARGGLWPHLELSGNTPAVKLDGSEGSAMTGRVGAAASYTLLDFGRTRQQIEAKDFQAMSMQARILTARETTVFETINASMQLIKYQRLIRIYERHIQELQGLVDKLTDIVAVFVGRSSELTQARTRLGQAKDALSNLRAKRREYQIALMRQVGASAADTAFDDAVPGFPVENVSTALADANLHHPTILAARAEASAARSLVAEARAARKPQIDVQIAKQTGRDALGQKSPTQLFLSAKWAAFQGFADQAAEQALAERAAAADAKVAEMLVEIEFNVHSAWADYEAQAGRVSELRQLAEGTDQVRKDYYTQWRDLGRRSLLDVLTAENEHLNTLLSLAGSEIDQSIALARMKYETGTLKEWLVGDDGRAVAADDEVRDVGPQFAPVQATASAPDELSDDGRVPATATRVPVAEALSG